MSNAKIEPCRVCGDQMSSDAMHCPHCGACGPVVLANRRFMKGCLMAPIILVVVVFGLIAVGSLIKEPRTEGSAVYSPRDSKAREISRQVKAELDTTTLEQMMVQIPQAPSSQTRDGERREITWTFSDGSKLVATFKPSGVARSERGLVLYSVDLRE